MLINRLRLPRATHPTLPVAALLAEEASALELRALAGSKGLERRITAPRIQKPGLALAGLLDRLHPGRVQILGRSEVTYLSRRTAGERAEVFAELCRKEIPCFILTKGLHPPAELLQEAEAHAIPILQTPRQSSATIADLLRFLEERLAPHLTLHGVLLDIYGVGVLLLGDSGVGKSECALDLIVRGHRLVSDDVVTLRRHQAILNGSSPELTRHHMELRGLGIINIKDLFGVAAVRTTKDVDMVIRLETWKAGRQYDRLGVETRAVRMLGVLVPFMVLPVALGRNLSVLVEVAARNHLLRRKGYSAARELTERLSQQMSRRSAAPSEPPAEGSAR
jgi:HPr kinase/phosphorylase